jgi:hypothetical protein
VVVGAAVAVVVGAAVGAAVAVVVGAAVAVGAAVGFGADSPAVFGGGSAVTMVGGDVSTGGPVGSGSAEGALETLEASVVELCFLEENHCSDSEITAARATRPSTTSRIPSVRFFFAAAALTVRTERGPDALAALVSTFRPLGGPPLLISFSRGFASAAFVGLGFGAVAATAPSP